MENRQYSHEFSSLESAVYNEITPSILDVPPVRAGYDPFPTSSLKHFGIALNLFIFKDSEVFFSILEEKFLRLEASHLERKYRDQRFSHRCEYFFYVPDFVDKDRLVVEWYNDHCVYVREGDPESPRTCVFADDSDEEEGTERVPPRKVSRGKRDRGESSSSGKDVASQTASSSEKESVPEEVAIEVESVSKESEGIVRDVSSQITSGSEKESGSKESVSEKETLEEEKEDISIVKEVLSQIISRSEKETESEKGISEEEEERIIVEELLSKITTRSEKESLSASGDKDLSAQSTSSYEKESMPKEDSVSEEVEKEQEATTPGGGWKTYYEKIDKLFQNVNQKAAGRKLKPVFVDKNYRPEADYFDLERDLEDQRIRNQIFRRSFLSRLNS